jgi:hypothetical protein
MLMADAAYASKGNRATMRDFLAALGERGGYAGVTGRLRFNDRGDPMERKIVMTRVRSGALVTTDVR